MKRVQQLIERATREQTAAVMGVANLTPDSFYDGGVHAGEQGARERITQLLAAGADIIDIGGESSKPGAAAVSAEAQIQRIAPALAFALDQGAVVSVDTANGAVAEHALAAGAHIVNDVTTLSDPRLGEAVARHGAWLVLCHSRGHQSRMPGFSDWPDHAYGSVVREVREDLLRAQESAVRLGVAPSQIVFDPGIGFSKNATQCVQLLQHLDELMAPGEVWLVGPGRKSFISALSPSAPGDRLGGTVAASLWCAQRGVRVVRVHDAQVVKQALLIDAALRSSATPALWSSPPASSS